MTIDPDLARYVEAFAKNNGLDPQKVVNDLLEKGIRADLKASGMNDQDIDATLAHYTTHAE